MISPIEIDSKRRLGLSQAEVAEVLGITKREVRAIEDSAMSKIKAWLESGKLDYLKVYLEDLRE